MATIRLPSDFKGFLKLLNANRIEYLLKLLKINKKASGRYKDLNDLENLP